MAVVSALRSSVQGLTRNPVIFAVTGLLALLQLPQFLAEFIEPLLASIISFGFSILMLVVVPFFQGGLLQMADEAVDGRTGFDAFVSGGKANYVRLLGAYALFIGVNMALGFLLVIPLVVLAVFFFGTGSASAAPLLIVGGFVLLVGLAYAVVLFFLQFYAQAIVLDGEGIIDSFRRSYRVVRRNLGSTLGYTILVVIFGGLFGAVAGVASFVTSPEATDLGVEPMLGPEAALVLAALLIVGTALYSGFFSVFSVAFYREIRGSTRA